MSQGIWWDGVEYRDVPGFPGYKVGDDGTVWTCRMPRGGRGPDGKAFGGMRMSDRWKMLKPVSARSNGHSFRVCLCRDGTKVLKFVHHLVLEAFVGPCPHGMVSRHGPKGRGCNSLDNLQWGTQKDNIADKIRDGTRRACDSHYAAKLTSAIVKRAREERAAGATNLSLAKKYGVVPAVMSNAILGKTWKDVT